MSEVFILQNQHQQFLDKSGLWVDGSEATALAKTNHKDEALNLKAEQSVRHPELRIQILSCPTNHKGQPKIDVPDMAETNEPLCDTEEAKVLQ